MFRQIAITLLGVTFFVPSGGGSGTIITPGQPPQQYIQNGDTGVLFTPGQSPTFYLNNGSGTTVITPNDEPPVYAPQPFGYGQ